MVNQYAVYIAILPLLYALWIVSCPLDALKWAANLKRKLRRHYIRKHGQKHAQEAFIYLRKQAHKEGIPMWIVEQYIQDHRDEIAEEYGIQAANDLLGGPNMIEDIF